MKKAIPGRGEAQANTTCLKDKLDIVFQVFTPLHESRTTVDMRSLS